MTNKQFESSDLFNKHVEPFKVVVHSFFKT